MFKFAVRPAMLVLALAVASPVLAQTPAPAPVQKPSQAQMKAALTGYFAAMNAGDAAKAQSFYAAGAMVEDPVGSALRPASEFVPRVVGGKPTFTVLLLTASNLNFAEAAVTLSRPNGTGVSAIEIFTFDPEGKITALKVYAGTEDRKG